MSPYGDADAGMGAAHGFGAVDNDQDRLLVLPAYLDIRMIFGEEKYRAP